MSETHISNPDHDKTEMYEIRIQGHLDGRWTGWFGGLAITLEEDGNTLMKGPVTDQAALYGLLKKVRDLGLTLLSVNPVQINRTNSKKGEMK